MLYVHVLRLRTCASGGRVGRMRPYLLPCRIGVIEIPKRESADRMERREKVFSTRCACGNRQGVNAKNSRKKHFHKNTSCNHLRWNSRKGNLKNLGDEKPDPEKGISLCMYAYAPTYADLHMCASA